MAHQRVNTHRPLINMGEPSQALLATWMGWPNGDTLVVDVTGLNGLTWLDRAGNFVSESEFRCIEFVEEKLYGQYRKVETE